MGAAHFVATPVTDRFERERAARGIDFDAVGKARLIENMAKIDPHSLRERDSTFLMKRRKVILSKASKYLASKVIIYAFESTESIIITRVYPEP